MEQPPNDSSMRRRKFLQLSALAAGGASGLAAVDTLASGPGALATGSTIQSSRRTRHFNSEYPGEYLEHIAFPLGGIGAGMICLEGTGALSHFSIRNRPEIFNQPLVFAAIAVKGKPRVARVLEGPVPARKIFGPPGTANGAEGTTYGLPRFSKAVFQTRFPFATIRLTDQRLRLGVQVEGWSPFEPGDADGSSLPVAALEYQFTNTSRSSMELVFSFNAKNFAVSGNNTRAVRPIPGGFIFWGGAPKEKPWEETACSVTVSDASVQVNHAWFRGGWWDALTMAWKDVAEGASYNRPPVTEGEPSPGATLFVPFQLAAGASKTIAVRLAWFSGQTNLRLGKDLTSSAAAPATFRPWYAQRFADVNSVSYYWRDHYDELKQKSKRFSDCFYDSTLPPEVLEAVAANLTILKSPTVLRQGDGKLWAWEGCSDNSGCCHGSCTHVWNYAQALPHLFPILERSLRETEFNVSQNDSGHQQFRSNLPIRPVEHDFHAASDGQLGGIMKVHREWRISGDTEWLRGLWPKVKRSLEYCIETWDPAHRGWVEEPHHNTYDIEFWGPDAMCTSFYLGALQAAALMGKALGEENPLFAELLSKGKARTESDLFNGEYFFQRIEWKNLRAKNPLETNNAGSPEAVEVFQREGPKYQYGNGCLSDGVLGAWLALMCGVGDVLDRNKVSHHLKSIHRYNLVQDLSAFANPQRPSFACGAEGGLLLCTWPKGGELSLPFVYSNEVWTGIEYHFPAQWDPKLGIHVT